MESETVTVEVEVPVLDPAPQPEPEPDTSFVPEAQPDIPLSDVADIARLEGLVTARCQTLQETLENHTSKLNNLQDSLLLIPARFQDLHTEIQILTATVLDLTKPAPEPALAVEAAPLEVETAKAPEPAREPERKKTRLL